LDRFKGYSLIDESEKGLINYFLRLYKSTDDYEIINVNIEKIKYNTLLSERIEVIHSLTQPTDNYLEIGVESGQTYLNTHFINKEGVDPDPKCSHPNLILKKSDDYFNDLFKSELVEKKDVIFIDGMHQSEYLLKDINNSIKILNSNGKIFIDDILPLTYDEQCKIPKKHFYENGILKYGECWTGDVWKVIYYLLLKFPNKIKFSYFYHVNFRGVGCFQFKEFIQIPSLDIDIINNYDYYKDFSNYSKLLSTFQKE
jgi:hypothetical protein